MHPLTRFTPLAATLGTFIVSAWILITRAYATQHRLEGAVIVFGVSTILLIVSAVALPAVGAYSVRQYVKARKMQRLRDYSRQQARK